MRGGRRYRASAAVGHRHQRASPQKHRHRSIGIAPSKESGPTPRGRRKSSRLRDLTFKVPSPLFGGKRPIFRASSSETDISIAASAASVGNSAAEYVGKASTSATGIGNKFGIWEKVDTRTSSVRSTPERQHQAPASSERRAPPERRAPRES